MKRSISGEKRHLVRRILVRMFIAACIGGLILGITISRNLNEIVRILFFSGIVALITGFVTSTDRLLVLFGLRRVPFPLVQIIKAVFYSVAMFMVFVAYFRLKDNNFILSEGRLYLFMPFVLYSWGIGIIYTLVISFSRMIGYDVILKYLSGRYHKPKEEERIFMFLDLKGSTTIAEQIGHKQFFSMMNDMLYDISDSIIRNKGEIYKYVGDEVIITWSVKNGLMRNNCIKVFFEIENRLRLNQKKYLTKYGLFPEFKAGAHIGRVVVGEMGDFKSEIAYLGDAMNTTDRIQSECNAHHARLLISQELLNRLEKPVMFDYLELGTLRLKGKLSDTTLFSMKPLSPLQPV
jgi:adenylate cyclase